jgi:hypothetical protein
MANTQTTVPIFVAAQVLEAAQLNQSAATGVPVFATTVTRDAGFGGAGEKALAEGQLCYLESTNVVQYYDGAAWATVGPAPAVSSGLVFISAGTVSVGATISLLNAFSTTYDFYSLRFSNFQTANDNTEIRVQLGSSGTPDTGANYNSRGYYADTSVSATSSVNSTSFLINENMGTTNNGVFLELSSPFLSSRTYFSSMAFGNYSNSSVGHGITGMLNTSTSYTDIFFKSNSGNIGPFTYALFGYAKS